VDAQPENGVVENQGRDKIPSSLLGYCVRSLFYKLSFVQLTEILRGCAGHPGPYVNLETRLIAKRVTSNAITLAAGAGRLRELSHCPVNGQRGL